MPRRLGEFSISGRLQNTAISKRGNRIAVGCIFRRTGLGHGDMEHGKFSLERLCCAISKKRHLRELIVGPPGPILFMFFVL